MFAARRVQLRAHFKRQDDSRFHEEDGVENACSLKI